MIIVAKASKPKYIYIITNENFLGILKIMWNKITMIIMRALKINNNFWSNRFFKNYLFFGEKCSWFFLSLLLTIYYYCYSRTLYQYIRCKMGKVKCLWNNLSCTGCLLVKWKKKQYQGRAQKNLGKFFLVSSFSFYWNYNLFANYFAPLNFAKTNSEGERAWPRSCKFLF